MCKENNRSQFLDVQRGMALVLMIIFHLAYDLNYFHFISIQFIHDPFWYGFPRVIVFLFLICVGQSQYILYQKALHWKKGWKRFLKVLAYGLVINLVTYLLFPQNYVIFGTLHCIAFCILICNLFLPYPRLCLGLFVLVIPQHLYFRWSWFDLNQWAQIKSMDYIPLYPWFAVALFGVYLGYKNFHEIKLKDHRITRFLALMGRHSLKIYLAHQIILFGLVYSLRLIVGVNNNIRL